MSLLPGLPQLRAGRTWAGAAALGTFGVLAATLVLRRDRIRNPITGPVEHGTAVALLAVALVAVWGWSWADGRRGGRPATARPTGPVLGAFLASRTARVGMVALAALVLAAALAPLLAPYGPAVQGDLLTERLAPPSPAHPLGTDRVARDVLSRLLFGARISLFIGAAAMAIALAVGTFVGAVAGYLGGWIDGVLMRVVDIFLAFPRLVLALAVAAVFQPSLGVVVLVLGFTLWPGAARLVRAEVLGLKAREFVLAAEAMGFGWPRVVGRHLVPNALGPVIVAATLGVGHTIVLEAGLSFLGVGVQPPAPSWGGMIADGYADLLGGWWLALFPGLAIVVTVLSLNLVGDALRDALDPVRTGGGERP